MADGLTLSGLDTFLADIAATQKAYEKDCITAVVGVAEVLTKQLFLHTPVWSGETVRNYAWGAGRIPSGSKIEPVGALPAPGTFEEENRSSNEDLALADMEFLREMTKLQDVYCTNFIDPEKWDLVENGQAPAPGRSRYPGGVDTLALQDTRSIMQGAVT